MGKDSKIAWTTHTFNAWYGCDEVSPACDNCYARLLMDERYHRVKWGKGQPRIRTSEKYWKQPYQWDTEAKAQGVRHRVFSLSLGDWLDDEVPIEWLASLLAVVFMTPHLDWLLLTKRIEDFESRMYQVVRTIEEGTPAWVLAEDWRNGLPPQNVWLGVTVENQEMADKRIPLLANAPAKIRFLSCEPLLEGIDLSKFFNIYSSGEGTNSYASDQPFDQVIFGGESGSNARPFDLSATRKMIQQCNSAGIAVFVKQLGRRPVENGVTLKLSDREGKNIEEFPADLQIRAFPDRG
jgi:protein gp37